MSASNPPRPPEWKKTIDDLMHEMKAGLRSSIGQPELEWAREHSRSLIPDGVRYPQMGDVYEALGDQTIQFMTAWLAPYTGSGKSVIYAGEQIWIDAEPPEEKPLGVYALPIDYTVLELRMVLEEERLSPKYGGFYLSVDTMTLLEKFKLVETGRGQGGEGIAELECGGRSG